eukprot:Pompholyxophrys_punicea_v1_NODE_1069_length_990_cov_1.588235.p1 type:complete len:203 gc:universal NODE_1069_length_990_cov_1.588235:158-766(+)
MTTMRAVRFSEAVPSLDKESLVERFSVKEVELPVPNAGEVLIQVHYAAINPADLMYILNLYGEPFKAEGGVGVEGCGIVTKFGGGLGFQGRFLVGKKVAFWGKFGSYAEYITVPAAYCFELPDTLPLEKAAYSIVNPLTVLGMIDVAKSQSQSTIVHTAAASSLGLQLIRHGKKEKVLYFLSHGRRSNDDFYENWAGAKLLI